MSMMFSGCYSSNFYMLQLCNCWWFSSDIDKCPNC